MSTRPRLNFLAIKEAAPILKVAQYLELTLKRDGDGFRCLCKKGDNPRAIRISPNYKNKDGTVGAFFCHLCADGGDAIKLTSHITGLDNYESAAILARHFKADTAPTRSPAPPAKEEGLKPLDLDPAHEALELYGLSQSVCEALGAGFCNKGMMVGRIAIPLRLEDGTLIGYMGFATKAEQKPLIKIPSNLEEKCGVSGVVEAEPEVKSQDELRKLLRVV